MPGLHLFLAVLISTTVIVGLVGSISAGRLRIEAQYTVYLWVFFVALGLVLYFENQVVRIVILVVKLASIDLILIPLPDFGLLQISIIFLYLFEIVFFLPVISGLVYGLFSLVQLAIILSNRVVWQGDQLSITGLDSISLILLPVASYLVAASLRHYVLKSKQLHEELRQLEDSLQQIVQANVSFQDLAQEAGELSRIRERKRITREIHDTVGYTFTNQIMVLEATLVLLDQPNKHGHLRSLLEASLNQARDGLSDIRSTLHSMRNQVLGDENFDNRLVKLCRSFEEATKVKVDIEISVDSGGIEPLFQAPIYRIVQEGLTNSFLHGRAHNVRIAIKRLSEALHIYIVDNGRGADHVSEGIGLGGMRERLSVIGGDLTYVSSEHGFSLQARIPLTKEQCDD